VTVFVSRTMRIQRPRRRAQRIASVTVRSLRPRSLIVARTIPYEAKRAMRNEDGVGSALAFAFAGGFVGPVIAWLRRHQPRVGGSPSGWAATFLRRCSS
jgi:hypothetical protein